MSITRGPQRSRRSRPAAASIRWIASEKAARREARSRRRRRAFTKSGWSVTPQGWQCGRRRARGDAHALALEPLSAASIAAAGSPRFAAEPEQNVSHARARPRPAHA